MVVAQRDALVPDMVLVPVLVPGAVIELALPILPVRPGPGDIRYVSNPRRTVEVPEGCRAWCAWGCEWAWEEAHACA